MFDHNDHYHRLLLRQLPARCETALDVGCGTGRFARRLAQVGIHVDAIDRSADVIEAARASSRRSPERPPPSYRQGDVAEVELPRGHYDYISCLASLHHVPFGTVSALRDALAPGGVLVILGCYPPRTGVDWGWSVAAVPVNAAARLGVAVMERTSPSRRTPRRSGTLLRAPVRAPAMSLGQVRRDAASLLPGSSIRRLLFFRYLLVFHNDLRPG